MSRLLLLLALCLLPCATVVHAQAPAEAKLREQLRAVMLQLRTLQGERDTLAAEKTQLETERKTLADRVDALTKQAAKDQDEATRTIATLTEKSNAQGAELIDLRATLEKWKASHAQAVELARNKEAARAESAAQVLELRRTVADQRTRNHTIYRLAKDILGRYESFGIGTAVAAREPFTGAMRVKLENLVQDYCDKVDEARIPDPKPAPKR